MARSRCATASTDISDGFTCFQDLLAKLSAAHNQELTEVQREYGGKISVLEKEVKSLRAKLQTAGISPDDVDFQHLAEEAAGEPQHKGNGSTLFVDQERDVVALGNFAVKPAWQRMLDINTWGQNLDSFMDRYKRRKATSTRYSSSLTDPHGEAHRGCKPIIFPNSNFRLAWDLCGLTLIGFDLFTIPFSQAFLPGDSWFSRMMDWVTLLFWTGDLVQGFFLGYYDKGHYVSSNRAILMHYLKTWFFIDLIVVGPEWLMLIATSLATEDGEQVNSIAKILKGARAVRVLRLLRLLKLQRIINLLYDMIESEWTFIVLNLAKLLVFVLVLNHVIACMWYLIGRVTMENGMANWIVVGNVNGTELAYMYTTSLHWSLTQFTPASMDVSARNTWERIFSIIVLFFALVTFSSIVASITGSTTSLRNMKTDDMKQFWLLRRYLRQRDVSNDLSNRIFKFLEHQMKIQSKLVQAKNIKILGGLSESLQNEMTHQMHSKHLMLHPFFEHLDTNMKVVMHRLCRYVLKPQSYAEKETVFSWGDVAKQMYFVKSGSLTYTMMDGMKLDPPPNQKDWVSEPVLWTDWRHQGDLTAETTAELIAVDPAQFVEVMSVHPRPWLFAKKYAAHFVAFLNHIDRLELMDILRNYSFYAQAVDNSESTNRVADEQSGRMVTCVPHVGPASAEEHPPECFGNDTEAPPEPPANVGKEQSISDSEKPRPTAHQRMLRFCPCGGQGTSLGFH
mmetsp:Transcript_30983/g.95270  ORF Transcript_30983/g.95270 Transcript_30983/m.95270 type:complete len:734 (-) Transcript_30983:114-2315(-)